MSAHGYGHGAVRSPRIDRVDPVWSRIREEADEIVRREPTLASFVVGTVVNHDTLEWAVVHRIAARLHHAAVPSELDRPDLYGRDPPRSHARRGLPRRHHGGGRPRPRLQPLHRAVLYFKGFHAIQTHRLAHCAVGAGRKDFALYLQSRSSAVFQTDIHPAARIGRGIFLDHATGLVVGETAVIEDNVSMLQDVTLGGTGKEQGDRHPKIRQRRADRRRRQDPRQYRDRPMRAGGGGLGRAEGGAAQHHGGGRAGPGGRGRRAAPSRRAAWTSCWPTRCSSTSRKPEPQA